MRPRPSEVSRRRPARTRAIALGGALCLVALSGCTRPARQPPAPVFYPPPPAPPRVQFLRSLRSSDDIRREPSAFERLVLGSAGSHLVEELVRPYGLAFWHDKLYVCDSGARRGVVLDFARRQFRTFGTAGAYRLGLPVNVSLGPRGEKYVTDTARGQVVVYDASDRPVRAITREGGMRPCDALLHEGELFVADLKTNTVLVLDPGRGQVLRELGGSGSKPGQFFQPTNLAFGPSGHLFVSDTLNARVQKLDRQGKVVQVIGSRGRRLGEMVRPKGIAVDREGRLYVADSATDSVQLFDAEGRLLLLIGGPGAGRGCLSLPAKVALSYDGIEHFAAQAAAGFEIEYLILVSSQLGPSKVSIYGFGRWTGARPPGAEGVERIELPAAPRGQPGRGQP